MNGWELRSVKGKGGWDVWRQENNRRKRRWKQRRELNTDGNLISTNDKQKKDEIK